MATPAAGSPPPAQRATAVDITHPAIKYALPQRLCPPLQESRRQRPQGGVEALQLRFAAAARGRLYLRVDGRVVWSRRAHFKPERRLLIPLSALPSAAPASIEVGFEPAT